MPTVAHVRFSYLAPTLRYIYQEIRGGQRYRGLVITNRLSNEALFPFEPILLTREINDPAAVVREQHLDLIHAHYGVDGLRFLPFKATMGIPMMATFRGSDATIWSQGSPDGRQELARLLRQGDHFIADSDDLKEALMALGCRSDKVTVLYSGIDLAEFPYRHRLLPQDSDELRLLSVGRLIAKKGIDLLIRALALVREERPRTRLTIIGDGIERGPLEHLVNRLRLQNAVDFRGWLPHSEIPSALDEADLLCLASHETKDGDRESIPNALKEAMASGLPVVATRHGGIPELVRHDETGLLADPGSSEQLAQAILRLSRDQQLSDRLTRAGRLLVEANFDLEIQLDRLEDLYDQVIARHRQQTEAVKERSGKRDRSTLGRGTSHQQQKKAGT